MNVRRIAKLSGVNSMCPWNCNGAACVRLCSHEAFSNKPCVPAYFSHTVFLVTWTLKLNSAEATPPPAIVRYTRVKLQAIWEEVGEITFSLIVVNLKKQHDDLTKLLCYVAHEFGFLKHEITVHAWEYTGYILCLLSFVGINIFWTYIYTSSKRFYALQRIHLWSCTDIAGLMGLTPARVLLLMLRFSFVFATLIGNKCGINFNPPIENLPKTPFSNTSVILWHVVRGDRPNAAKPRDASMHQRNK